MALLLAGDIGGTKTILRLVERTADGAMNALYEFRYPSGEFPDLVPIVQQFLTEAATKLDLAPQPEKACFAIAGPVVNNSAKLTNLPWLLDAKRLEEELGISRVSLINDFVAVGYGVCGLEATDIHTLQVGKPSQHDPIAVIGAGTGLGHCFAIPEANGIRVFSSEGGHGDFAPRSELEFELLKYLLAKHDIQRISIERVVSGQGIVSIYQFLRDRKFAAESAEVGEAIAQWESEIGKSEKTVDPGAIIAAAALQKCDQLSEQTMQMFVEAYGAVAGNMAVSLLPYGGLYVAGGIAAKILPLILEGSFMRAFTHKGRMDSLLEMIPVRLVLNGNVGLIGAAVCAAGI
ncbi:MULTISPECIES: glucokinase [unclassified Microcoleus]|uniref:glucokinase n=1 Tax=unclassified Microcoleus TaxID=2642155 RepID=UPI0025D48FE2|nr:MULTISPECIES: glucokinase [unclassified Microcoleus]